jgi:twitching motility protein PilT
MAQLDQLIDAMLAHQAEALLLRSGRKPCLLLDGAERTIVKTPLNASQLSRLTAEIAPSEHRSTVAQGGVASFAYDRGGQTVQVEVGEGPQVRVRPAKAAIATPPPAQPRAAAAPAAAAAETPPAPAPEQASASQGELTMDGLLRRLVKSGGSDLHLSSGSTPLVRVDGEMEPLESVSPLTSEQAEQLLLSIAPERNVHEFKETGDTDFAHEIEGLCRFRSNLFMDRRGPGGVFRVIPSEILTVDDLNIPQTIRNLCFLTKGLVLVTGPTGSGKSTTLCALIDHINKSRHDHVITIEDPIEFVHPNRNCLINQREVHQHTKGFKPALRAALREDPDVVLVGEMRDLETVAIAIETAETGHLVFGTLHTSSAVSTIDRIIDQFPADQQEQIRIMLSESLKSVIAQVLCKKIGGGRVAALEVLMVNAAVSNLIREGKTFQIPSIMQTGRSRGNVLLNSALVDLVKNKVVEPNEAYAKTMDKQSLVSDLKKHNIRIETQDSELTPA